jgi:hypothetical protein
MRLKHYKLARSRLMQIKPTRDAREKARTT